MTIAKNKTSAENGILDEKLIRMAFHSIPGVGSGRLRQLIAYFGSALKAWQATESELRKFGTESWLHALIQNRHQLDPDRKSVV